MLPLGVVDREWPVRDRSRELETLAALYRELSARRQLRGAPTPLTGLGGGFSLRDWLGELLGEVGANLGALGVGLGFFVRPGTRIDHFTVVRPGSLAKVVEVPKEWLAPDVEPTVSDTFARLIGGCVGSAGGSITWGVAVGDKPSRQHMAMLVELPPGQSERQRRVVGAASVAVWASLRDTLLEFVQPELWEMYGLDPFRLLSVGEKRAAYLFADLSGFTALTELVSSRAGGARGPTVDALINEYASAMHAIVKACGRIDKFMGDGVMAVFGDATPKTSAKAACQAAVHAGIGMLRAFTDLERAWRKRWIDRFLRRKDEGIELTMRVGVAYGPAMFSFIATPGSRHYTPIGRFVNLAQRLEQSAGSQQVTNLRGSILTTATVRRHVGDRLPDGTRLKWIHPREQLQPKGVAFPIEGHWVAPADD